MGFIGFDQFTTTNILTHKKRKIMLSFYYRIWVSILLQVKKTNKDNATYSLISALIVITVANFVNYLVLCLILYKFFDVNFGFLFHYYSSHRYLTLCLLIIIFMLPNYLILIHNNKSIRLIDKYKDEKNKNLGVWYYAVSAFTVIAFIIFTILF